ncbi:MAG: AI-2E family transporter [Rhodoferax sp.]|jgi:predicted PurR-regulated permease PerM|nr:AI-2E family transporter [Rhodoferax sp.]MBP9683255.1 AI-2E family transporter [Rhodoferax sp.]
MNPNRYLAFAATFMLLTAWMLKAFLPGIIWGAVFAISLWPLFEWVTQRYGARVKNPALLFSFVFLIVFVLPLAYVVYDLVDAYRAGSSYLTKNQDGIVPVPPFVKLMPYADKLAALWTLHIGHSDGLLDILNQLSENQLKNWLSEAALQLSSGFVTALCMLVSFYFMLKGGQYIKDHYEATISHWFSDKSVQVVNKGVSALRGTINGVILIGLVEGVLLAVPLVLAGVKSGLLLGLAAGLLGVIPMVMPVIILPAIVYLYFSGEVAYAVIMVVDLLLVWIVFENVVKPGLISNAVKVNPYLVLLGLIGGLQLLGPVGLFIGPAIVSMSIAMARDILVTDAGVASNKQP